MSRPVVLASRRSAALALLCAAALSATSCDKKNVVIPGDGLVGVPSASQLVVWPDTPTEVSTFNDTIPLGPGPEDRLIGTELLYFAGAGTVLGMVQDVTEADRFEVFRNENGEFRRLKDYTLYPAKRFLHGHVDVFRFTDYRPGSPTLRSYIARGLVDGSGVEAAPKTNVALVGLTSVPGDLDYIAPTGIPPDFRPMSDSLLYMEWAPYPGAAGYWVHVYQLTDQSGDEIILSGVAAPFYVSVTRDYFLAFVPGNVTAYKVGDPVPSGMRILTQRPMLNGQVFNVRVSAVDADGELIGYTGESEAIGVFRGEGTFRTFPLGAAVVQPRNPVVIPQGTSPTRVEPLATSNPRLWIYPAGTAPRRFN